MSVYGTVEVPLAEEDYYPCHDHKQQGCSVFGCVDGTIKFVRRRASAAAIQDSEERRADATRGFEDPRRTKKSVTTKGLKGVF